MKYSNFFPLHPHPPTLTGNISVQYKVDKDEILWVFLAENPYSSDQLWKHYSDMQVFQRWSSLPQLSLLPIIHQAFCLTA